MAHLRDLVRIERAAPSRIPAWLDRIVSAGIVSADPDVVRRQRIVNVAALAGAANAASRVIGGLFYDAESVWLLQLLSAFYFVAALLVHRLHRFGDNAGALGLVTWFIFSAVTGAIMFGLQSQIQAYFVLAGIVWLIFGLEHWRLAGAVFAALVATLFAMVAYIPLGGIVLPADSPAAETIAFQSLVNAIAINAVVLVYALMLLRRAEAELRLESLRAEALLNVVFPESVARRLQDRQEKQIADSIDGVSVLFADLVDFTPAAHQETPKNVVAYLDGCVREFERLCERDRIEKIKTIGDAFMFVGGLHGDSRRQAVAIGQLALDLLAAQENRPPLGRNKLQLRIGIHYGPAIAGVIGDTRISYDLWGDAVNVASRMESHGEPGRIHVSEAYRAAAADAFAFEERGETDIKGIGTARTYFLLSSPREVTAA